jgi:hypothetical protein
MSTGTHRYTQIHNSKHTRAPFPSSAINTFTRAFNLNIKRNTDLGNVSHSTCMEPSMEPGSALAWNLARHLHKTCVEPSSALRGMRQLIPAAHLHFANALSSVSVNKNTRKALLHCSSNVVDGLNASNFIVAAVSMEDA